MVRAVVVAAGVVAVVLVEEPQVVAVRLVRLPQVAAERRVVLPQQPQVVAERRVVLPQQPLPPEAEVAARLLVQGLAASESLGNR